MIEDTNQAVDMFIKGPNGWTHKFYLKGPGFNCIICGEAAEEHLDERNRIEQRRDELQRFVSE